jgi:hypothetical protein
MGVVSACALSFMSKYLHQSCGPKPMTRVDINDNNQSSNNPPLISQTSPFSNFMEKLNPKIIFHLKILILLHMIVNLIMQRKKSILTMSNLFMTPFYLLMMLVSGQYKLINTHMTFMIHVMSLLLKISMNLIEILNCMTLLLIHCFN